MRPAYICDAIRTPIGKYGGALSGVRADDLAVIPIKAIVDRNPQIDPAAIDEVIMGCANQSGEDNRNVARMALLLAGLPHTVPALTVNRLCGSGMEAVGTAARMIGMGDADLVIAGGIEHMTRAPLVMGKADAAFSRQQAIYDTTMGWRFVNSQMEKMYGVDAMIDTAGNLANDMQISREDQDLFAWRSQSKAHEAQRVGLFAEEIIPVAIPQKKGTPIIFDTDEHPRLTALEKLSTLKTVSSVSDTITAGNASGINDGAAALLVASAEAVKKYGLKPLARILGMQAVGVPPRIMGIGPVPATQKLLARLEMTLDQFDILEINEAFAAQALACTRSLGLSDDDPRINPRGGAIALGHPLGMSGARLITTASHQLQHDNKRFALCTMCIGVGQGIAMAIERYERSPGY